MRFLDRAKRTQRTCGGVRVFAAQVEREDIRRGDRNARIVHKSGAAWKAVCR